MVSMRVHQQAETLHEPDLREAFTFRLRDGVISNSSLFESEVDGANPSPAASKAIANGQWSMVNMVNSQKPIAKTNGQAIRPVMK